MTLSILPYFAVCSLTDINRSGFATINSPYFIVVAADCSQIEHKLGMGDQI